MGREGEGLVYNVFFDVPLARWMPDAEGGRQVVRASGLVIVNVDYEEDASGQGLGMLRPRVTTFEQSFPAGPAFVVYNLRRVLPPLPPSPHYPDEPTTHLTPITPLPPSPLTSAVAATNSHVIGVVDN